MTFVTNHDKNAWEGTEFELFGQGLEAAIVLSVVGEGMPLVYNGQEAGNPVPRQVHGLFRWTPCRAGRVDAAFSEAGIPGLRQVDPRTACVRRSGKMSARKKVLDRFSEPVSVRDGRCA